MNDDIKRLTNRHVWFNNHHNLQTMSWCHVFDFTLFFFSLSLALLHCLLIFTGISEMNSLGRIVFDYDATKWQCVISELSLPFTEIFMIAMIFLSFVFCLAYLMSRPKHKLRWCVKMSQLSLVYFCITHSSVCLVFLIFKSQCINVWVVQWHLDLF